MPYLRPDSYLYCPSGPLERGYKAEAQCSGGSCQRPGMCSMGRQKHQAGLTVRCVATKGRQCNRQERTCCPICPSRSDVKHERSCTMNSKNQSQQARRQGMVAAVRRRVHRH